MGRQLLYLLLIFFSLNSSAVIVINSITGASKVDLGLNGQTQAATVTTTVSATPQIYGGTAGVVNNCAGTGQVINATDNTCNSCAGTTSLTACNLQGIYPNLSLQITFYSTTLTQLGVPLLLDPNNNVIGTAVQSSAGANAPAVITVRWADICNVGSSGSSDCSTPTEVTLQLGFSVGGANNFTGTGADTPTQLNFHIYTPPTGGADDTVDFCGGGAASIATSGVCGWRAFPGDAKIYLDQDYFVPGSNFPNVDTSGGGSANVQIDQLLLFYSTTDFASILPSSPYKAFQLQTNANLTAGTIASNSIDVIPSSASGFDNYTPYFFRLAAKDQAGNVAYFTSDQAINTACSSSGGTGITASAVDDNVLQNCPFIAKPDPVHGLLNKDLNCFIASAAYGSFLDSRLQDFRAFRSRFILSNSIGRSFNKFYYTYGPYAARFLEAHSWIKFPVRLLLTPVWLFARLSLWTNLWATILFLICFCYLGSRLRRAIF